MSAKDLDRLQRQTEQNSIQLQQLNANNARRPQGEGEFYRAPAPQAQPQPRQPQYNEVEPEEELIQNIALHAANEATRRVQENMNAINGAGEQVKKRMQRLVEKYPALQDENSQFVQTARDEYKRIAEENPGLDEATRYELSVESTASLLGARPVNKQFDPFTLGEDFTLPPANNPARGSGRSGKTRLTPNIIANAKIMGINVDPKTKDGQANLKELDEYSARFNADVDETQYKYR